MTRRGAPADEPPVEFAFADPARRTWLSVSRDGTYYHVVTPIPAEHVLLTEGRRAPGDLGCTCAGGRSRGTCYVVKAAEEAERAAAEPTWFDEAVPA